MTSGDPLATGVIEALIGDSLLSVGIEPDELLAMSHEQRLTLLSAAVEDGRFPKERAQRLRELGVLPSDPAA